MEFDIHQEAKILSRDYSMMRKSNKKWKICSRLEAVQDSIFIGKDVSQVQISRDFKTVDVYLVKALEKRLRLKRNKKIFECGCKLWEVVNPFRLGGISGKVYKAIFKSIYIGISKDLYTDSQIDSMVQNDFCVDFDGGTCLGFVEFYDAVFEVVDTVTKSKLILEYVKVANQVNSLCEELSWSNGINLYSKTHIDGKKKMLAPWMTQLLKSNEEKELPKVLKSSTVLPLPNRLLKVAQAKPVDRENFNIRKLEKVVSENLLKRRFKLESFEKYNQTKEKPEKMKKKKGLVIVDRKARTFYSNYIEKISPLSSLYSVTRGRTDILESVISGRKNIKMHDVETL